MSGWRITIASPTAAARTGNRVHQERWARLLARRGHRVTLDDPGAPVDLLIALHARKSAAAVAAHRAAVPEVPVVVALTGTDLYGDLPQDPVARRVVDEAEALVVLQPRALDRLEPPWRDKARVIEQSVEPLDLEPAEPLEPSEPEAFDVCVLGHLRDVKDPLRPALAARCLPASSRIRVIHIGAALEPTWAQRAEAEAADNPRYQWLGERPSEEARRRLAACRLLVLPSSMEGGAIVIGEAAVAGVGVIASRIDGNVGLLGDDHPGLFPVGDTAALATLLTRAEAEPAFLDELRVRSCALAPRFAPPREEAALDQLVRDVCGPS